MASRYHGLGNSSSLEGHRSDSYRFYRLVRRVSIRWKILLLLLLTLMTTIGSNPVTAQDSKTAAVQRLKLEILATYPHDPTAYTQGLLLEDGVLFESTGLYQRSTVRRTDAESGRVMAKVDLDPNLFGEGLAKVGNRLIQLTWKAGVALVYDAESLELLDQYGYNGVGWGLAYDGQELVMSDGTSRLTFRDPVDLHWLRTIDVTLNGKPVKDLNELEVVGDRIYANVYTKEYIVRIDPATGFVNAVIDASGLLSPAERRIADVLNGIAFDPESETFLITGKFWAKMYRVRFVSAGSKR